MPKPTRTLTAGRRERDTAPVTYRLVDVASKLGLSASGVRNLIRRGALEGRRIGRSIVVPREELERFVRDLPPAA